MSDDVHASRQRALAIALFAVIAGLIAWDLAIDYGEGAAWQHVVIELVILVAALLGIVLLLRRLRHARSHLAAARDEATRWQTQHREILKGLSAAIDMQFREWQLTTAESEVALLLLKGLSLKEVAALRETSERTAREQSRAVYRKSGLGGRPALAAFFLEDLLLPLERDNTPDGGNPAAD